MSLVYGSDKTMYPGSRGSQWCVSARADGPVMIQPYGAEYYCVNKDWVLIDISLSGKVEVYDPPVVKNGKGLWREL